MFKHIKNLLYTLIFLGIIIVPKDSADAIIGTIKLQDSMTFNSSLVIYNFEYQEFQTQAYKFARCYDRNITIKQFDLIIDDIWQGTKNFYSYKKELKNIGVTSRLDVALAFLAICQDESGLKVTKYNHVRRCTPGYAGSHLGSLFAELNKEGLCKTIYSPKTKNSKEILKWRKKMADDPDFTTRLACRQFTDRVLEYSMDQAIRRWNQGPGSIKIEKPKNKITKKDLKEFEERKSKSIDYLNNIYKILADAFPDKYKKENLYVSKKVK